MNVTKGNILNHDYIFMYNKFDRISGTLRAFVEASYQSLTKQIADVRGEVV